MTRNQIDALRLQEERRANLENEKIKKIGLPAEYLSSIGSIMRGTGSLIKGAPISRASGKIKSGYSPRYNYQWTV